MNRATRMEEYQADKILCFYNDDIGDLGTGSFGTVRSAHHEALEFIAVKCFLFTGSAREKKTLAEKFARERDMLGNASHEYIVRVYGWVRWPGAMAIVMEYLPGGNLKNLLLLNVTHNQIAPVLRLRMSYEMSCGIALIHNISENVRMAHGDLKPENIVLTGDLHCKLGDFGCAQIISYTGSTQVTNQIKTDQVGMTMAYAAPERLNNLSARVKKEQDTYSYGIILHMVLSCESPYRDNEFAYTESVRRGQRPDLEAIEDLKRDLGDGERHIVEVLESMMKSCWQQEPSQRPRMTEVREKLSMLLNQQDQASILRHAADIVDHMDITKPSVDDHRCVPLHKFSVSEKRFVPENENVSEREIPFEITPTNSNDEANLLTGQAEPRGAQLPPSSSGARLRHSPSPLHSAQADFQQFARYATVASIPSTHESSHSQQSTTGNSEPLNRRDNLRQSSPLPRSPVYSQSADVHRAPSNGMRSPLSSQTVHNERESHPPTTISSQPDEIKPAETLSVDDHLVPQRVATGKNILFDKLDNQSEDWKKQFYISLEMNQCAKAKESVSSLANAMLSDGRYTAENVKSHAEQMRKDKELSDAILFYHVAALLYEKGNDTAEAAETAKGIKNCIWGMELTAYAMVGTGSDQNLQEIVKSLVIPVMRELGEKIQGLNSIDEDQRAAEMSWCKHYVEVVSTLEAKWSSNYNATKQDRCIVM